MKRIINIAIVTVLVCAWGNSNDCAAADFSDVMRGDWTLIDFSVFPPVQVPIPWTDYSANSSSWGELSVCGVALGLPYGDHSNVYGLDLGIYERCEQSLCGCQIGLVADCNDMSGLQLGIVTLSKGIGSGVQLGIFNYSMFFSGLQLGIVNYAQDAMGVQLGLWNINEEGYFLASPILNMRF